MIEHRDEPSITEVKRLNPRLPRERLNGKHLILDLRAIDVQIAQATGLSLAQVEALRANRTP